MSRSSIAAAAALAVVHGILGWAPGDALARTLAILAVDIVAALWFLWAVRRRTASGAVVAITIPADQATVIPPAEVLSTTESATAVPSSATAAEIARWRRQDAYLRSCGGFLQSVLNEHVRLGKVKALIGDLRTALMSLNQLNESIQQNADQVCGVAKNIAGSAEQGFNLSRNVQANVVTLAENITASLRETENLLEESKRISDILTIMSDIATTTNVLSINASIVAARAGTKGREFDVVAKEVRKLSVSTEESLTSIALLIKDIQNKVQSVSGKLDLVNTGILREKDSMLSVAGTLQGVTLAVEIIDSVTGVSGETARNGQTGVTDSLRLIDAAISEFTLDISEEQIRRLQAEVAALIDAQ